MTTRHPVDLRHTMLNKVPEVTIYFWIIKILCTTVGESFADYGRERTLSIHSIVTTSRELWYWLTVLVTFALGTAVGDWTIELTGWSPGQSVMLPLGLILGSLGTSVLFLGPILAVVVFLTVTDKDRTEPVLAYQQRTPVRDEV